MKSNTKKTALCGVFSALAVSFMLLGTVFEIFDLTSAAISSFFVFIIVCGFGCGWGTALYFTISLLSFIFFPGKIASLSFITVGYYPIIKRIIEGKFYKKIARIPLKLFGFNIGYSLFLLLCRDILFADSRFQQYMLWVILFAYALGNFYILLFDIACDKLIRKYSSLLFRFFS